MQTISYVAGASLPALQIQLIDDSNQLIDLTGFTATVKLGLDTSTTALTKTTGLTCSATGIQIAWSSTDLDDLAPGNYIAEVNATDGTHAYIRHFNVTIEGALA